MLSFFDKKYSRFFDPFLIKKTLKKSNFIIIWSFSKKITKDFINKKVFFYNGKNFVSIFIRKEMLNFRFGEFFLTRKSVLKNNLKLKKKF